ADNWMIQTMKNEVLGIKPGRSACSDEPFKGPFSQAPLPGLAQAGQHHQTSLDIQEKMSKKRST
ncbi:MAG: hypothetical protein M1438_20195, partial [Deltaproteobacteria bacterium]|nr:hypothetical protein [Deltaproteobacteria bacterium]